MVYNPRKRVRRVRKYVRKAKLPYKKRTMAGNKKITRVVKKVMARAVETKVVQYNASLNAGCISSSVSQAQLNGRVFMITPQGATIASVVQAYPIIGSGVGQDQRVGDEIKIKGIYVNYLINANGYEATTNPNPRATLCTIWVVRPKRGQVDGLQVGNLQAGAASANFFENQFNSDSGFIGSTVDMLKKVDRDNYQVLYCKTVKIGYGGTLNTTNAQVAFHNNDFKQFYRGRIKIKGMNVKFDRNDVFQGQPMYMFCQCTAADGTTYNNPILPVSFVFNEAIYYTDS